MIMGDRIRERRNAIGMTADRFAEIIGKNRATVYRYENGTIDSFTLDFLNLIADTLQTSPAYLMGWTNNPSQYATETEKEPCEARLDQMITSLSDENQKRLLDYATILLTAQKAEGSSRDSASDKSP